MKAMNATQAQESTTTVNDTAERDNLLACLAHARYFLRFTTRDLDTEQVSRQTTVSALTLGGLIKHVTGVERGWAEFMVSGAESTTKDGREFEDWTEEDWAERENDFQMQPGDTLEAVLAEYKVAAASTDELVRALPSLDVTHELPKAPWNVEDAWSVRRVLMHIILETSQHAGHADIIRESLDGAKSMG